MITRRGHVEQVTKYETLVFGLIKQTISALKVTLFALNMSFPAYLRCGSDPGKKLSNVWLS
jgi:hypothetical protein